MDDFVDMISNHNDIDNIIKKVSKCTREYVKLSCNILQN